MFSKFKEVMQQNFTLLLGQGQRMLYMTDVDRDKMWETYLNTFPDELRQEYNCNCCKSFVRHYGGLVAIINSKKVTIWDFVAEAPFDKVAKALNNLVKESQVVNLFFSTFAGLGTDSNVAMNEDKTTIRWGHLFFKLPKEMIVHGTESVESLMGKARDNRNVFKRGLEEITLDAVDAILELIAQNSIYRGADYKGILEVFKTLKVSFDKLSVFDRDNWTWEYAPKHAGAIAQIRNTAIGTLLIDISTGRDLDESVSAFERIMAPTSYKRPNAIITKKMIEEAEKTITNLGYGIALGRRFATVDDLTINHLLFVNRDTKKTMGILGDLKETTLMNPKSFTKVEEVTIDNFLENILPRVSSVEVLFENKHENNLVSLITAKDDKAPSLFKWDNNFSWSYKNSVTDSIKEKVKSAGGNVEGELRVSLEWYNFDDLDLHVQEPDGGKHIHYASKISSTGGNLDVDMNAGGGKTREAVENIIWPDAVKMKEGKYKVYIHQYSQRETIDVGFSVQIECQGQVLNFTYDKKVTGNVTVAEFEYSKKNGLKLLSGGLPHDEKIVSKNVWGVDTNQFHTASMILKSPNMWDSNVGNSHLIFVLDKAHNDEQARGFFNEFLKEELVAHKRVFEAVGSRMKVDPAEKQVSGLGFSVTQHSDLIVKVDGKFTRTLKIKF